MALPGATCGIRPHGMGTRSGSRLRVRPVDAGSGHGKPVRMRLRHFSPTWLLTPFFVATCMWKTFRLARHTDVIHVHWLPITLIALLTVVPSDVTAHWTPPCRRLDLSMERSLMAMPLYIVTYCYERLYISSIHDTHLTKATGVLKCVSLTRACTVPHPLGVRVCLFGGACKIRSSRSGKRMCHDH